MAKVKFVKIPEKRKGGYRFQDVTFDEKGARVKYVKPGRIRKKIAR